jgi:hypothetical protein
MIFMGGSHGNMWRTDANGGFNGFGDDINGVMWRSDGNGGWNIF